VRARVDESFQLAEAAAQAKIASRARKALLVACAETRHKCAAEERHARGKIEVSEPLDAALTTIAEAAAQKRVRLARDEAARRQSYLDVAHGVLLRSVALSNVIAAEHNRRHGALDHFRRERAFIIAEAVLGSTTQTSVDACRLIHWSWVQLFISEQVLKRDTELDESWSAINTACAAEFNAIMAASVQAARAMQDEQQRYALEHYEGINRDNVAAEHESFAEQWEALAFGEVTDAEHAQRAGIWHEAVNARLLTLTTAITTMEHQHRSEIVDDAHGAVVHAGRVQRDWLQLACCEGGEAAVRHVVVEGEAIERTRAGDRQRGEHLAVIRLLARRVLARVTRAYAIRCAVRRLAVETKRAALEAAATKIQACCRAHTAAQAVQLRRARHHTRVLHVFAHSKIATDRAADLAAKRDHRLVTWLQALGRAYLTRVVLCYVADECRAAVEAEDDFRRVRVLAAMKIQWLYREHTARGIVRRQRAAEAERRRRDRLLAILQAAMRGRVSVRRARIREFAQFHGSINTLQRFGRGDLTRAALRPHSAALAVQRFCRAKLAGLRRYAIGYGPSAAVIQRMVRCFIARRKHHDAEARVAAFRRYRLLDNAARIIQQLPKIVQARRLVSVRRTVRDIGLQRVTEARHRAARHLFARVGRGAIDRESLRRRHQARHTMIAHAQRWLHVALACRRVDQQGLNRYRCNAEWLTERIAAHAHALEAAAVVASREAGVTARYAATRASAAVLTRVGRAFRDRLRMHRLSRLYQNAAVTIQRNARKMHARLLVASLRRQQQVRVIAQERSHAASVIQRTYQRRHVTRAAAATVLQRCVRRRGLRLFAIRKSNRESLLSKFVLGQRAVLRVEKVERYEVNRIEDEQFKLLERKFFAADAPPLQQHSCYPAVGSRVLPHFGSRLRAKMAALTLPEEGDAMEYGRRLEAWETHGRRALVSEAAVALASLVVRFRTGLAAAQQLAAANARARVARAESALRVRIAKRHLLLLRHAIVEPFHITLATEYSAMRRALEVTESSLRAAIEAEQHHVASTALWPPIKRVHAAAKEAQRQREAQEQLKQVSADASALALSTSGTEDDRRKTREAERYAALARRLQPLSGKLRPFSKVGALEDGVTLTAKDLRTILGVKPAAARMVDEHTDDDDRAERRAQVLAPPILPPLLLLPTDGKPPTKRLGSAPVSGRAAASGRGAANGDRPASSSGRTTAAVGTSLRLSSRPSSGSTLPRFLRRVPELLQDDSVASLPKAVREACVTTPHGLLSLASVAALVTDLCVPAVTAALRKAPIPAVLDLTDCQLSDTAVMTVLEECIACPHLQLEELLLRNNKRLTDAGAMHIGHRVKLLPALRFVDLGGTHVTLPKRQLVNHLVQVNAANANQQQADNHVPQEDRHEVEARGAGFSKTVEQHPRNRVEE
jgi:hypothetical protein